MKIQDYRSKQRGTALLMSMIMLLLMSAIVLQGARSSVLELLIGNNVQHAAEALLNAEDSVIFGENVIEANYAGAPSFDNDSQDDGVYIVGDIGIDSVDWSSLDANRSGSGDSYREYVVEYLGPAAATGGSLSVGAGAASDTRYIYRVSGRGESTRGGARVVQTIYATAE